MGSGWLGCRPGACDRELNAKSTQRSQQFSIFWSRPPVNEKLRGEAVKNPRLSLRFFRAVRGEPFFPLSDLCVQIPPPHALCRGHDTRWSFTSPHACMNAYIVVGLTKRNPRDFSALLRAFDCAV